MENSKRLLSRKNFCLIFLLCAVLLAGCSAETKTEIHNWWNMCVSDMTNGDLFITVLLASWIGGALSK
jgi:hypothetical protein